MTGVSFETAIAFVKQGISVIPQYLGTKIPKFKWDKYQSILPTELDIAQWFKVPSNGAVVTGTGNLVVIDFDDLNTYIEWGMWAATNVVAKQVFNEAYKVRTARGIHVYVRAYEKTKNYHYPGIDVKGFGGLVTIPGSVHPSGHVYERYDGDTFPVVTSFTEILPDWMMIVEEQVYSGGKEGSVPEMSVADILDMDVSKKGDFVDLEQLKRQYRVEDMLGEITMTGANWGVTQCPFHKDANPSFWVDFDAQLCGCFSGCTNAPLDSINLYARLRGVSNTQAIKEMSGNANAKPMVEETVVSVFGDEIPF